MGERGLSGNISRLVTDFVPSRLESLVPSDPLSPRFVLDVGPEFLVRSGLWSFCFVRGIRSDFIDPSKGRGPSSLVPAA